MGPGLDKGNAAVVRDVELEELAADLLEELAADVLAVPDVWTSVLEHYWAALLKVVSTSHHPPPLPATA